MFKEFSQFLMRGNVMDLAVGVIIGAAFNGIVEKLVSKLFMPIVGMLTGGINFEQQVIKVGDAELGWGAVLQALIQFLIIGFVLFLILKAYNRASANRDASYAPPPTPSEALLIEIRDLLKKQ